MKPTETFSAWLKEAISARDDVSPADKKRAVKDYGKVQFADAKNKKYPLDSKHIRAAISYFGVEKNYSKYSDSERKTIAKKISSAAKKFGVDISPEWKAKHGIDK